MTGIPLTLILLPFALWRLANTVKESQKERGDGSKEESKLEKLMRLRLIVTASFIFSFALTALFVVLDAPEWFVTLCWGVVVVLGISLTYVAYRVAMAKSGY
jgi:hypothetical protein